MEGRGIEKEWSLATPRRREVLENEKATPDAINRRQIHRNWESMTIECGNRVKTECCFTEK